MADLTTIRREAKSRGLRWSDVVDCYRGIRAQFKISRDYDAEIRKAVWSRYQYTPNCLEFYWCGMQRRFPRAFSDGDRTLIPGFDTAADGIKYEFPQFDVDDPAEALFEFLQTDPIRMPPAEVHYREALELVSAGDTAESVDADVPF